MSIGHKRHAMTISSSFLFAASYQIFRFGISIERIIFEIEFIQEDGSINGANESPLTILFGSLLERNQCAHLI